MSLPHPARQAPDRIGPRLRPWWQRDRFLLIAFWVVAAIGDRLWFALDRAPPLWDQSDHLSRAMTYWQHLQHPHLLSGEWWTQLWLFSPGYRAPFVYLLTTPFLQIFGPGYDQAGLVNLVFSGMIIASVYHLGKQFASQAVGLWAAALVLAMPYLAEIRTDYWLDYGLTAAVTLTLLCLTYWRSEQTIAKQWFWTCASGISAGLVLLTKPTGLLFLLGPSLWLGGTSLRDRQWLRCGQLAIASGLALSVIWPWFSTNWLTVFTSSQRAVDTAPTMQSPWLFYLAVLPTLVPWVVLAAAVMGALVAAWFWQRRWLTLGPSGSAWRWWIVLVFGAYLSCSAVDNRTARHILPIVPIFILGVAYGLISWPGRWGQRIRWGTFVTAIAACIVRLFPVPGANVLDGQHLAYTGTPWPHQAVLADIEQATPGLVSTIGVATNTGEINPFTLDFYSRLAGTARSREIGFRAEELSDDLRAFEWYVTKTGSHGPFQSILTSQAELRAAIANDPALEQWRAWDLPDGSELQLYRRRQIATRVEPFHEPFDIEPNRVQCDRVTLPASVAPGTTVPVTYEFSGSGAALRSGLVLMTWTPESSDVKAPVWWHDRAIAAGQLSPQLATFDAPGFRVTEQLALWVPAELPTGRYRLHSTYLDRVSGQHYDLDLPATIVDISSDAPQLDTPQLDFVTQLRQLGTLLAAGELDTVFDVAGRLNQYDATQDYLQQAERTLKFRLERSPDLINERYALGLAQVLQRQVRPALQTFRHLTEMDADNPYAWTYVGFINLYRWHPRAAEAALERAHAIDPDLPELKTLQGVAALMRLNLMRAWELLVD
ncbi:MAG: glycosyltransferase family 39 protein [Cyanobacteria bacterium P01_F01_bin.33]